MKQEIIKYNGLPLFTQQDDAGEIWVAIKPIVDAIGLNWTSAHASLKNHPVLGGVYAVKGMQDTIGRVQEMGCIPLNYVAGWLFSINIGKVGEQNRELLIKFQLECHLVLFDHFFGSGRKVRTNTMELYKVDQELRFAKAETKRWKNKADNLEQRKAELLKDNYIQYRLFEETPLLENAEFEETE